MSARRLAELSSTSGAAISRSAFPGKFRIRTPWAAKTYEEQAQRKFAALLARVNAVEA